jgi:hypothetical protein
VPAAAVRCLWDGELPLVEAAWEMTRSLATTSTTGKHGESARGRTPLLARAGPADGPSAGLTALLSSDALAALIEGLNDPAVPRRALA